MGVFSFYGNKIITTGEGGMVVTNDADLAERMRVLRSHGMSRQQRYVHPVLGFNYRLTNIQAALGVGQMERADEVIAAKRGIARQYGEALADLPGLQLPPEAAWAESVYWLYSVLIDESVFGLGRDELIAELGEHGLETRPFFTPVHRQPIYESGLRLPVAEDLAARGLSLPSSVGLTPAEIARVTDAVRRLAR